MAERLAARRVAAQSQTNPSAPAAWNHASAGARAVAYLIDSALLFCVVVAFVGAAALVLLINTDSGREQVSGGEETAVIVILMLTLPTWVALNFGLMLQRGQTAGQYLMGLGVLDESGVKPSMRRLAAYWLSLHPLLFHPLLAHPWLLLAYLTLEEHEALFVAALAAALLCLLAPLAAAIFLLADPARRTIHDRLAGIQVVALS